MLNAFASQLNLIPARSLRAGARELPNDPGVYMFFLGGGLRLLHATSYFDTTAQVPPTVGDHTLLYIGAATTSIRERVKAHFATDSQRSSLRLTLFAIEHARRAISASRTPFCRVVGPRSLSDWLFANALIMAIPCMRPLERERWLIEQHGTAFNIIWRRQHVYAQLLMEWREAVSLRSRAACTFK
jgi:hypothetical protein